MPFGQWLVARRAFRLLLATLAAGAAFLGSAQAQEEKKPQQNAVSLPPGAIHQLGIVRHPPQDTNPVGVVAFSSNGKLLAASAGETLVYFWDPAKLRLTRYLLAPEAHQIHCLAFSPDDRLLATGDSFDSVLLWDLPDGTAPRRLRGHRGTVNAVAFHPDGKVLASAGSDGDVLLWDLRGRIWQRLEGHRRDVTCLAFGPDGKILATGSLDGTIRFWDPATGKHRRTLTTGSGTVGTLVFTADGKEVIAEGDVHDLCRWDPVSGRPLGRLKGHRGQVLALALDRKGRTLASGSRDGSLRLWDLKSGKEQKRRSLKETEGLTLAFSADGQALVFSNRARVADLWRLKQNELLPLGIGPQSALERVFFDEINKTLITETQEGHWCWELATGKLLGKQEQERRIPVARNANSVPQIFNDRVQIGAKLLPRQQFALYAKKQGAARFQRVVAESGEVTCLELSLDGKLLAAGMLDGSLRIWEVASWQRVYEMKGHTARVTCMAFSRSGRLLVSGSEDATALVWDLAACTPQGTPRDRVPLDGPDDFWAELGQPKAARAFRAVHYLHSHANKAIASLKNHMPAPTEDKRVPQLLRDLDADTYPVRQKASDELAKLGKGIEAPLRQALEESRSPEVRSRLRRLLGQMTETTREERAWYRAILFLEREGSPSAKELLETLARHPISRCVSTEAQAALKRMKPPSGDPFGD